MGNTSSRAPSDELRGTSVGFEAVEHPVERLFIVVERALGRGDHEREQPARVVHRDLQRVVGRDGALIHPEVEGWIPPFTHVILQSSKHQAKHYLMTASMFHVTNRVTPGVT